MADNKIIIDLAGLADYTPYEGMGSNDLLTADGMFSVKIGKITAGRSKESNNPKFTVQVTVQDEDNKGKNMVGTVLLGGTDSKGGKLIRQLGDLLTSVGMTMEAVRALSGNGTFDAEELAKTLTGKIGHVQAEARHYEGRLSSSIANWVTPQAYKDAVAASAHRKPHRAEQTFSGVPAGAQAGAASITNLGGGQANGAAGGAAVDPLKKLQGLTLPGLG